jgi:tetratricopeptide (TPR) repeat protein
MGDIDFHTDNYERAIKNFTKALDFDSTHLGSLQYLVRIYEGQGSWEEAYEYGMKLVEFVEDEDELYSHYMHMAGLCREKLQDPFRAGDALQGAYQIRPASLDVLTGLRDVFLKTRQYQKAVAILEQMTGVEERPRKLVEYHVEAGDLLHGELHDNTRAVEHYNAALDVDPSLINIFQRICGILTKARNWITLRDNYVKMIKRVPGRARKTKVALWKDLGELCRVVLRHLNEAIDAYRMVSVLDPEDVNSLATLGDLLAASKETTNEAISIHHKVVAKTTDRVASYRSLWKLYNKKKEYDKVYVLASILKYLDKADEEEKKIVQYFSKHAPDVATNEITDRLWEKLMAHPGLKVPFTRIFGIVFSRAFSMFIKTRRQVGLRRRDLQIDTKRDQSLFVYCYNIASRVLGCSEVDLFGFRDQRADNSLGMDIVLTNPLSVIAYKEMFQEGMKKRLLFRVARVLALTRPEFILACVLSLDELNTLLQATCLLVSPGYKVSGDSVDVERTFSSLKQTLSTRDVGEIRRAVVDYLHEPRAFNLKAWLEAVEHSVNWAGFVVCNDLGVALDILRQEETVLAPMRTMQKVREMLVFASSPEYFQLREYLGLAISG